MVLGSAAVSLAHGEDHPDFAAERTAPVAGRVSVPPEVQKAIGVIVRPVEEKVLAGGFSVNGAIDAIPNRSADINAPLAGRVIALRAVRGAAVGAGQPLVLLDSPEIRQLAVEAERGRTQARAALTQAEAKLRLAENTYQRERALVQAKISARRDFQVAEAERAQARAELAAAQSQVRLADALLTSRLAQLGQRGVRARPDGSVVLSSPVAGVVADQRVSAGEAVEPGRLLYRVVNLDSLWATAGVYEKDLANVRMGQRIEISTPAYPGRTFRAQVISIDPAVDPDTRTVGVRALLANPGGLLKPGMFATLRLITAKGIAPVPVVPRSAVLDIDGQKLVYVQNGDAFEPVAVQLGQASGELVEVKDGLYPGDLVVVQRAFQLRAQALKGDIPAEDSASGKVEAESLQSSPQAGASLPWWVWGIGGLLVAAGSFLAGVQVARRGEPGRGSVGKAVLFPSAEKSQPSRDR
jgi:cobalt-zinc-cadmium efflux system membrane fusion protein